MAEGKRRHGCLTAYLGLMIIATSIGVLAYFLSDIEPPMFADAPEWVSPFTMYLSILNIVWAIALFKWKKWGFWGLCVTFVVLAIAYIYAGLGISSVINSFAGIAILYGVLHIGKENKGWSQLD